MTLPFGAISLATLLLLPQQPTFEIADVHPTPRVTTFTMRTMVRAGRYEVHNATMVDLIKTAYGVDAEHVVGGPTWLEFDRFDVTAKIPNNTAPPEALKSMLQGLLADRFKLVVHNDTRPISGFALTIGKGKPKLKEAEPSGKTGCQTQPLSGPIISATGQTPTTTLSCHNTTMEAFASTLRGLSSGYISNTVVDSTGLNGSWDFDLKFTPKGLLPLAGSNAVTIFDAVDKQLGLKLDEQKLPMKVVVVDQVNKKPTDNPPDLEAKLPGLPKTEFEVADIKPSAPNGPFPGQIGLLPGGRVNLPRFPLKLAISLAWNLNPNQELIGTPKWLDSAQFDIVAKVPAELAPASGTGGSLEDLGPMLQALLKERFKMTVHFEDRPVTAYTLTAPKPKLKKADPATRTSCTVGNGPTTLNIEVIRLPSRLVTCQNITMAQFVDQLQILAGSSYLPFPVLDATALEGAWDFSFTFSPISPNQLAGARGATPFGPAPGTAPASVGASDPIGGASVFDAVEKQLGLKLEEKKRSYPVLVIDHIEEKPTEN